MDPAYDAGNLGKSPLILKLDESEVQGPLRDQGAFLPGDDQHAAEEAGDGGEAAKPA